MLELAGSLSEEGDGHSGFAVGVDAHSLHFPVDEQVNSVPFSFEEFFDHALSVQLDVVEESHPEEGDGRVIDLLVSAESFGRLFDFNFTMCALASFVFVALFLGRFTRVVTITIFVLQSSSHSTVSSFRATLLRSWVCALCLDIRSSSGMVVVSTNSLVCLLFFCLSRLFYRVES